MTTILYTPGTLTVDSRRTSRSMDLTEQGVKVRRFYEGTGMDDSTYMRFGDDLVTIGAGAGNSATLEFIFTHLKIAGKTAIDALNSAFGHLTGFLKPMGSATILLVGQKAVYQLSITINGHGEKTRPRISMEAHSLSETLSLGTGGYTAETLFNLFNLPPELAVAATTLYDPSSGDDVIHCELDEHGYWTHSRVKHYDPHDLLAKLTEYFKGWDVKKHPFAIKKLPKMATNALVLKPDRAYQDRTFEREKAREAERAKKKEKPVVKETPAPKAPAKKAAVKKVAGKKKTVKTKKG